MLPPWPPIIYISCFPIGVVKTSFGRSIMCLGMPDPVRKFAHSSLKLLQLLLIKSYFSGENFGAMSFKNSRNIS